VADTAGHRDRDILVAAELLHLLVGNQPSVSICRLFGGVQSHQQFDTTHLRIVVRGFDDPATLLQIFVVVVAIPPGELHEGWVELLADGFTEPVAVAVGAVRFGSPDGQQVDGHFAGAEADIGELVHETYAGSLHEIIQVAAAKAPAGDLD